jgi:Maltose acetyltransferase
VFLLINDGRISMTERDKMLAGELYDPLDADLVLARERARDLWQDPESDT